MTRHLEEHHRLSDHPARAAAISELHARPAPSVPSPAFVLRHVLAQRDSAAAQPRALVETLCAEYGASAPGPAQRYHVLACAFGELRWESHTEFETFTFIARASDGNEALARADCPERLLHLADASHMRIASMRLHVEQADFPAQAPSPHVCLSLVADGRAVLETAFAEGTDGYVDFRLRHAGLSPAECGVFVQRVLEIETYRMMALLAVPLARQVAGTVPELESSLARLTRQIGAEEAGISGNALFEDLTALAARIESEIGATTYRFAAAGAYSAIVEDRLRALHEKPYGDHPMAGRFLLTRLTPAMRTCNSMQGALKGLAERFSRASDLIRTRIDLELAVQNNTLLQALNQRTRLQMRLQQTVEGLSIAAISYYIAGLLGYGAKGLKEFGVLHTDPAIAVAGALPFIVLGVGWTIYRIRRSHRA